ncbi:PREDICTED: uncharacterized protein LOC104748676 [Camelina sativa]|uniref:ATP-dependent DNA helicase n=1 Tax=Camelina sativa TaxID=90675 RepID=A0ABM0WBF4_CAMSA|nr:PREDICTED: uncharacterized protein LOC104748676 [Camelina sativa]
MTFMAQTVVDRIESISDDPYLSLSRFDSVLSGNLNPNFLIDIIGQVVNVGEMQTIDVNNKPTHKIDFELRDESDVRITCTLWASFADQIYAACQEVDVHRVICLLRFANIRLYNDVRTISNAFHASQLIINPDYVEVIEFMGKLPNDGLALTILEGNPNRELQLANNREFYQQFPSRTIKEILEAHEVGRVKLVCTIYAIDCDWAWYYIACKKCNKKVTKVKPNTAGSAALAPNLEDILEETTYASSSEDNEQNFDVSSQEDSDSDNSVASSDVFVESEIRLMVQKISERYKRRRKGFNVKSLSLGGSRKLNSKGDNISQNRPEGTEYLDHGDPTYKCAYCGAMMWIQERENESQTLLRSKRLFQQFLVDAYTSLESNRLKYIKFNQSNLRCDNYASLEAAAEGGNNNMEEQGKQVRIPASFTGGPRYMLQSYYDAMTTCKQYGFPDLFITFTCNPKWPEITRYLKKSKLNSDDRPDIMCRMFKIKLESLMRDLTEEHILGKTTAAMYTIEFQKRGLPHAHILLFMDQSCKLPTGDDINKIISAEIPDKLQDPELYDVVKDCMIHGPCGAAKPNSPCMVDGKCSKFYPKVHVEDTSVGKDGYPVYRRRVSMAYVEKNDIKCDNRYVVPYNRLLSLRYRAHINVEWCNQSGSIKYLFKYINKGQDRVAFVIEPKKKTTSVDNGEGNGSNITKEAGTGHTSSSINLEEKKKDEYRSIPVMKLPFHPPGKQPVYYKRKENIEDVLERRANVDSMFMAYLKLNQVNEFARQFTYAEIPKYFTWDGKIKQWKLRERGFSIGRINYVPQKMEAEYYMRILLGIVTGPKSDEDIRTYRGVVYDTYKKACWARSILEDDQAYIDSILEASAWFFGPQLRNLFTMMLLDGCLSRPEHVWETTWQVLSEDIENMKREQYNNPALNLTEDEKKNYTLYEIEELMLSNGGTLQAFDDMPKPTDMGVDHSNRLITEEKNYNRDYLKEKHDEWISKMTSEQRAIYEEIMCAVLKDNGGVFFVYGFGGTGKTFMWKTLSAAVRYRGLIAINVASSGIASLLLEGGRTAHSRFCIPINPDDFSMCNINPTSDLANMLKETSLIIWDEAPMMSRYCFENLDRSLSDIMRNGDTKPFGGKVVVFGGDFRQVLPVINGAGRAQIVLASLNSSYLWEHCKVLTLTKNMQLMSNGVSDSEAESIKEFSDWILVVGDGKINEPNDGEALIDIPDEFLIKNVGDPIDAISRAVYGNLEMLHNEKDPKFFQTRAILCPTNKDVHTINERLLEKLQG